MVESVKNFYFKFRSQSLSVTPNFFDSYIFLQPHLCSSCRKNSWEYNSCPWFSPLVSVLLTQGREASVCAPRLGEPVCPGRNGRLPYVGTLALLALPPSLEGFSSWSLSSPHTPFRALRSILFPSECSYLKSGLYNARVPRRVPGLGPQPQTHSAFSLTPPLRCSLDISSATLRTRTVKWAAPAAFPASASAISAARRLGQTSCRQSFAARRPHAPRPTRPAPKRPRRNACGACPGRGFRLRLTKPVSAPPPELLLPTSLPDRAGSVVTSASLFSSHAVLARRGLPGARPALPALPSDVVPIVPSRSVLQAQGLRSPEALLHAPCPASSAPRLPGKLFLQVCRVALSFL